MHLVYSLQTHFLRKLVQPIIGILLIFLCISCETSTLSELAEDDQQEINLVVTYDNTARNILDNACVECHNSVQATAGIQMQNFTLASEVAASGRMIARMTDINNPMPPSGNLPDALIEDILNWIDDGLLEN